MTRTEVIKKLFKRIIDVMNEINIICERQRATSIVVRYDVTSDTTATIILKDIRNAGMRERVKTDIEKSLCKTLTLVKESDHALHYALAV